MEVNRACCRTDDELARPSLLGAVHRLVYGFCCRLSDREDVVDEADDAFLRHLQDICHFVGTDSHRGLELLGKNTLLKQTLSL